MRRLAFTWDRRFFSLDQPPSSGQTEVRDQTDLEVLALVEDIFTKHGVQVPASEGEPKQDDGKLHGGSYEYALDKALDWLAVAQHRKLQAEIDREQHKRDVELAETTYEMVRTRHQEPWNDLPADVAQAWLHAVKALREEFSDADRGYRDGYRMGRDHERGRHA